ncbi:MAG: phosphatidylserine decarboxylase [bacterium]|nr:phosphatidylserine decarboxylase [bacterium]
MSSQNRTPLERRGEASPDLPRILKRNATLRTVAFLAVAVAFLLVAGLEAADVPQMPPFLEGLPAVDESYEPQQDATRELKRIIEEESYQDDFLQAIGSVYLDAIPELNSIQTLDQFYFYVDALVTWIPGIRVWELTGEVLHERTVYLRLTQFYFYFNKPSLAALQSPIAPGAGAELTPISEWMRDFAREWGSFLDTPASAKYLATFKYAPEYSYQDYQELPEVYVNFNHFFGRKLDNIAKLRPVASPEDERVIVAPADTTYIGQWMVSTAAADEPSPAIVVKHIEWTIAELLADTKYAADFEGGIFTHSFLNTYNYHRLHVPVSGKVLEAKIIRGQVYLEVFLRDDGEDADGNLARAVIPRRYLDAEDGTGYQFVQSRGLIVLDSPIGKVAVLPIGMAQVSSVVFVDPAVHPEAPYDPDLPEGLYKRMPRDDQELAVVNKRIADAWVGRWVDKGDMFSIFQFGGSDIVTVFERKANVHLTAAVEDYNPVRSQIGNAGISLEEVVPKHIIMSGDGR